MTEKINKWIAGKSFLIPVVLLGIVLVISFASFLLAGQQTGKRVLFFPDDMTRKIRGETRYLPVYDSETENIELLVRELLLGPEYLMYDRAVPKETRLNTLIFDKGKLYLDFSMELALSDERGAVHFEEAINIIKKTVTFNFKNVRTVNITVDGQNPGSAYYSGRSE
ncbi:MAG: GerMN domain-containing protein [Spirochaetales bacterium]|nr:GerMN domain-containing protein [Spirochaetales bacterium]